METISADKDSTLLQGKVVKNFAPEEEGAAESTWNDWN